jgi:hypothetical protein
MGKREESHDTNAWSVGSLWQRLLGRLAAAPEAAGVQVWQNVTGMEPTGGAIAAGRVLELPTLFSLENLARAVDTFPHMTAKMKIEQQPRTYLAVRAIGLFDWFKGNGAKLRAMMGG